jgi:hypothetical protein
MCDIAPAERNPKRHDMAALDASLDQFAFAEVPLVDERTGRLVAGHGRVAALVARREEGRPPPEGVVVDDDGEWLVPVIRGWSSSSDAHAEAYVVTSNRLTESGGWYNALLVDVLEDVATTCPELLDAMAFTADDIDELLSRTSRAGATLADQPSLPGDVDQADGSIADGGEGLPDLDTSGDQPAAVTCPACGHQFPLSV